jgi:transcriptional regulator with XRE-family HTH domain
MDYLSPESVLARRIALKLTQAAVAKRAQITQASLSYYEAKTRDLMGAPLRRLGIALCELEAEAKNTEPK